MPSSCSVPQCRNKRGGHRFPKEAEVRNRWIVAVRRANWQPTGASLVCHNHFTEDDYVTTTAYGQKCERKILKPGAVPSQFRWTKPLTAAARARINRAKNKERRHSLNTAYGAASLVPKSVQQGQGNDVQQTVQHCIGCTQKRATAKRVDSPGAGPSLPSKVLRNVHYCLAPNCKNNGRSRPDLSMFRLPKDPERFNKWVANCGWKHAAPNWFICSEHFEADQFVDKQKRNSLVWDAVPTIFTVSDKQLSTEKARAAQGSSKSLCPSITAGESIRNTTISAVRVRMPEKSVAASGSAPILYDAHGTLFILVGNATHTTPHTTLTCTTPNPQAKESITPKEEPPDPDLPPMPETCPVSPMVEEISIIKEEVLESCEAECPSMHDPQPLLRPSQLALGAAGRVDGVPETLGCMSSGNVSPAASDMEEEGVGVCDGDVPMYDSYGTPFVLIEEKPPDSDHTHVPHTPAQQNEGVPKHEPNEIFGVKEDPFDEEQPEDMLVTSGLLYTQDTKEEEKEEEDHKTDVKCSSHSLCPDSIKTSTEMPKK